MLHIFANRWMLTVAVLEAIFVLIFLVDPMLDFCLGKVHDM